MSLIEDAKSLTCPITSWSTISFTLLEISLPSANILFPDELTRFFEESIISTIESFNLFTFPAISVLKIFVIESFIGAVIPE